MPANIANLIVAKLTQSMVPKDLQSRSLKLFKPVQTVIDFLEPTHTRYLWGGGWSILFYGPSIYKWRDAILYLKPELELNISFVEEFRHRFLALLSRALDCVETYRNRRFAAVALNVLYETAKARHEKNETGFNHLLAALQHRISMLYCMLFDGPCLGASSLCFHRRDPCCRQNCRTVSLVIYYVSRR
jgi:hypothetical protein